MNAAPGHTVGSEPARALAGVGLRAPHEQEVLDTRPEIGWLEVHSENYFGTGGRPQTQLLRIAEHYPISLHGIGLGLGNEEPPEREHVHALRRLCETVRPQFVSEHLCWNGHKGRYVPDLLPLLHTPAEVVRVANHIDAVQQALGRTLLIENVSRYVEFEDSQMPEWTFLLEVVERANCGILLDVNNIYVNANNQGFDAHEYLRAIPAHRVGEIHLAGHTRREFDDHTLLIDTHDRPIIDDVWALYEEALTHFGPKPTLIERDANLPPLPELLSEAIHAADMLETVMA